MTNIREQTIAAVLKEKTPFVVGNRFSFTSFFCY